MHSCSATHVISSLCALSNYNYSDTGTDSSKVRLDFSLYQHTETSSGPTQPSVQLGNANSFPSRIEKLIT
jgi:hypothetical protein